MPLLDREDARIMWMPVCLHGLCGEAGVGCAGARGGCAAQSRAKARELVRLMLGTDPLMAA